MMIEFILQAITLFIISAIPFFAGWMANEGKLKDVWIPLLCSVIVWLFLLLLFILFY